MNLTDQQIQRLIDAWQKDFGETLSFEEAEKEAKRLVAFFMTLAENESRRRVAKTIPAAPTSTALGDHGNLKVVWRKTMRKRHV